MGDRTFLDELTLQHCSLVIYVHSRYHKENRNMPFGEFKFGPLFMRLCYELGLEELAATTLTDPVGENEHTLCKSNSIHWMTM